MRLPTFLWTISYPELGYNIEKDSIFFLSPKHLHTFRHLKDINGIGIIFTEDLLLHLDTELLNCIKAKLFYPIHGVSHCTLQENAKRKIERYAKLLQEESESNTKDTSLKYNFLASALSLFLIDIIRLGDWEEADKLDVNSDPHRTYWLFVDLVEKNFAQHHSVKFYTEALRISQTTLAAHTQQYTPVRDKIAISCMWRQIRGFSSHAIRHGLYIKNRKRLFCP